MTTVSHSEPIPPRQTATEMVSGCGPGLSRAADVAQEGVRESLPTIAQSRRRVSRLLLQLSDALHALNDSEERGI